jgi:ferredoxin-NADP reductase
VLLHELLTKWEHAPRSVYVCGSNVFVEAVTSGLVLEDIPPERIRTERFGGKS